MVLCGATFGTLPKGQNMEKKTLVVTPIDLRSGKDLVAGEGWAVRKPSLWTRSDAELRSGIKRAGSHVGSKDHTIRLVAERIGYENVGFRREWS